MRRSQVPMAAIAGGPHFFLFFAILWRRGEPYSTAAPRVSRSSAPKAPSFGLPDWPLLSTSGFYRQSCGNNWRQAAWLWHVACHGWRHDRWRVAVRQRRCFEFLTLPRPARHTERAWSRGPRPTETRPFFSQRNNATTDCRGGGDKTPSSSNYCCCPNHLLTSSTTSPSKTNLVLLPSAHAAHHFCSFID